MNTTSSPTYSVATTGSSRKRGVCELPFDDAEESSLNGGQSFMSTSSFETKVAFKIKDILYGIIFKVNHVG